MSVVEIWTLINKKMTDALPEDDAVIVKNRFKLVAKNTKASKHKKTYMYACVYIHTSICNTPCLQTGRKA